MPSRGSKLYYKLLCCDNRVLVSIFAVISNSLKSWRFENFRLLLLSDSQVDS